MNPCSVLASQLFDGPIQMVIPTKEQKGRFPVDSALKQPFQNLLKLLLVAILLWAPDEVKWASLMLSAERKVGRLRAYVAKGTSGEIPLLGQKCLMTYGQVG